MESTSLSKASQFTEATEIFHLPEGVHVFSITPEGRVLATNTDKQSTLRILRCHHSPLASTSDVESTTFLQVGTWTYPLLPGSHPSIHPNYGAYIFPDLTSGENGVCVGIILDETVALETQEHFRDLITQLTALKETELAETVRETVPQAEVETLGHEKRAEGATIHRHKYSQKMLDGAELIACGIQKNIGKVDAYVRAQSDKLKDRIEPDDGSVTVHPLVERGCKYARVTSGWTYKMSKKVGHEVGQLSLVVARYLTPKVGAAVEKATPRRWRQPSDRDGRSTLDNAFDLTTSAGQSACIVYVALEDAAKFLAAGLINESVSITTLKYGKTVGDAVRAGGNVVMTGLVLKSVIEHGIAKTTAKDTGNIVFENWINAKTLKKLRAERSEGSGSTVDTGSDTQSSTAVVWVRPNQADDPNDPLVDDSSICCMKSSID